MPFLAAAVPALIGGAASAAGGAVINGVIGGPNRGTGFQATQGVNQGDVQGANSGVNDALQVQRNFLDSLQAQNGIGNQSSVFNQLQGVANGQGPNPAQALLANQTGANIASQASLMAGQRGSSANAGLIARQAGMQGGNLQQQAVGQGAALQAQQSLGALNQLGGIAGQQVAQQQAGTNALAAGNLQRQQQYGAQLNDQNAINAQIQKQTGAAQIGAAGGLAQGIGALGGMLGQSAGRAMAPGAPAAPVGVGPIPNGDQYASDIHLAQGGQVGPRSSVGRHLKGMPMLAKGGKVPAMVSPGEVYLSPKQAAEVVKSGKNPLKVGEKIKGKAKVSGDSEKNDTVKKTLESGGVVVPRTSSSDSDKATQFVEAIMAKHGVPLMKSSKGKR